MLVHKLKYRNVRKRSWSIRVSYNWIFQRTSKIVVPVAPCIAAPHSTVSGLDLKIYGSRHLCSWLCRGTELRKHRRQRGTQENEPYIFANSGCRVTNSLFKLVRDLQTLKFRNEPWRVSGFRNVNLTSTTTHLLDIQVPELGYKPGKSKFL